MTRVFARAGIASILALALGGAAAAPAVPSPDDRAAAPTGASSPTRQATEHRMTALRETMAKSDDLRLRIVFSYSFDVFDAKDPFDGDIHPEAIRIPIRTLGDMARKSTDPVALDLLFDRIEVDIRRFHGCGPDHDARGPCDLKDALVDVARRWSEVDAENQRAWLALARAFRLRGDETAARATYLRAARAPRWREYVVETTRLVADAAPLGLTAVESLAWNFEALLGALKLSKLEPDDGDYCASGPALRDACLRIVDASVRDAESTWIPGKAARIASRAGAPVDVVAAYRQREDAAEWALDQDRPVLIEVSPPSLRDYDEGEARDALVRIQPRIYLSERDRAARILIERQVGEAEAASRFAAAAPAREASLRRFMRELDAKDAVSAGSARSTTASP